MCTAVRPMLDISTHITFENVVLLCSIIVFFPSLLKCEQIMFIINIIIIVSFEYHMVRRVLMAEVSRGRVRGRSMLSRMDGVKVALGNRGRTVEAA